MSHWEHVEVEGPSMRLFVDAPPAARAFAAVIVIQHGPGVDKFIEDRVENLAQHGYLAVAPDLYHRQPEDGDMMTRIGRLRDPEVVRDVNATVSYLRRLKDTQLGDIGIIGFCMGGRVTYLMAGSNPVFKAAGVFYGGNIKKAWGEGPPPFGLTPYIRCPIAGFFGMDDTNPSPSDVEKISAQLKKYGKLHEFHIYPAAGHAFLNFLNPTTFREEPAKDVWEKLLEFLRKHLSAIRQPR